MSTNTISANDAADAAALAAGVPTARNAVAEREQAIERSVQRGQAQSEANARATVASVNRHHADRSAEDRRAAQAEAARNRVSR